LTGPTGPTGAPGPIAGSNTQIIYNSSGSAAGSANLTFDGTYLTANAIRSTNDVTAYYSSDRRLKENVRKIDNALALLAQIDGVRYDWTNEYIQEMGGEDGYFVRKQDVGVIAQDVQKVLPEVVGERSDGILAVKYERIVALLIEAVKELKRETDELRKNTCCGN